ncbi:SsgA family sporulation/cell division regulator [Streptomyces sp. NPDC006654]|uniref:SsgA family sporulation/cell division regulator n=1 Tax=Streptomyces sp. NPDC006654 TaxID=3156897 RepID=UPI0034020C9C
MTKQSPKPGRTSLHTPVRRLFTVPASEGLSANFHYTAADPLAVSVELVAGATSVTWVVARELLEAGMHGPSGLGDFRVWPSPPYQERGRRLYFSLDRPDGRATYNANLPVLRRWLDATYALVPQGSECELLDWEAVEADLLGTS